MNKYREPIVYFIVGVLVTVVDYVSYSVLVKYAGMNVVTANIIAWIAAVLVAYVLNRKYVFISDIKGARNIAKEAGEFAAGRLFSGGVVTVLIPVLMWMGIKQQLFGVEGFIAKGIASVIGLILNYFISKFWVFKK